MEGSSPRLVNSIENYGKTLNRAVRRVQRKVRREQRRIGGSQPLRRQERSWRLLAMPSRCEYVYAALLRNSAERAIAGAGNSIADLHERALVLPLRRPRACCRA